MLGNAIYKASIASSDLLVAFFNRIEDDPRIGVTHIALYAAIVRACVNSPYLLAYGRELRSLAKIGSSRTYHKTLKDLQECGYIKYTRSTNRWEQSVFRIE